MLLVDDDSSLWQDVLLLHFTQRSTVFPAESLRQVVEVLRHERVEGVFCGEEAGTVLHEIVDELAKHYLEGDVAFEASVESPIYFSDRLLRQEASEVTLSDGGSFLDVGFAERCDNLY